MVPFLISIPTRYLGKAIFKPSSASPTTVTLDSFRKEISGQLVESAFFGNKKFLPESSISKLVTEAKVGALLQGALPGLVQFVCNRARRVFLTVLWSCDESLRLVSVIESFRQHELTDDVLPVEDITIKGRCKADAICPDSRQQEGKLKCTHDAALNVFHNNPWDPCKVERFLQNQWMFSSPVFKKTEFKQILDANSILPFIWVSSEPRDGHFSIVRYAELHVDHQDELEAVRRRVSLGESSDSNYTMESEEVVHVAIKELKKLSEPGYRVETAWESEAMALGQISELHHPHLIRRIAAFKHGQTHYIMFEWANGGNLREVWAENRTEHRNLNGDRIMEFLEQLRGLAGALCALHNTNPKIKTGLPRSTKSRTNKRIDSMIDNRSDAFPPASVVTTQNNADAIPTINVGVTDDGNENVDHDHDHDIDAESGSSSATEHWRHGDLKPENILKFGSTWLGTLKIADLGLAKRHEKDTILRIAPTDTRYTTLHYEAPEAITSTEPRSRRYDIWSMGCIILESIIWLLYGYDVLNTFYQEDKHINDPSTETLYFIASRSQRTAEVSYIASSWMEHILKEDPECNKPAGTALGDLLKLVQNKLLVVPLDETLGQCRTDASTLYQELGSIWTKAMNESSYLFTGTSRADLPSPNPSIQRKRDLLSTSAAPGYLHRPSETSRSATARKPLVSFISPPKQRT
jgi:serine/threonine protein kinase